MSDDGKESEGNPIFGGLTLMLVLAIFLGALEASSHPGAGKEPGPFY